MKFLFSLLFFFVAAWNLSAQELFTNPDHVFHNNEGVEITGAEAKQMLYGTTQKYQLKRQDAANGKTIIRLVPVSEKAYWKSIEDDKKTVKKLKGTALTDYQLTDMEGKQFTNATVAGQLTIYNFWFTGCRPCLTEIPQLNELVARYGDRVKFVAPTFDSKEKVERFLQRKPFDYEVLTGATNLVSKLRITSYPTHLVVDEKGIVQQVFIGKSETIGKLLDKAIRASL
ncbi:MAG: TlpA disulfide reductase family protein [Bacteroidota bacterium]